MDRLVLWALGAGNAAILLAELGRDGALHLSHLALPVLYTIAYVGSIWFLRARGRPVDPMLLGVVCALTGIGLAALVRLDADLAFRQVRWIILGIGLFTWISLVSPWNWVRRYRYVWAIGGLALLSLTALFGVRSGGARSWLDLGFFSFQPVEIAKICVVFFLSSYLAENRMFLTGAPGRVGGVPARLEHLGPIGAMALLFALALVAQRDLGAALILVGLCVWMLTAATGRLFYAVIGGGLAAAGGAAAVFLFDHVRIRFKVWLDPWSMADGPGYQIVESMFALAGGGFFGSGWGHGLAHRIPAVETDFIYSLIVEEVGFIGAAGLLFLFAVYCIRALHPALDPNVEDYVRLGTAGLSVLVAMQTFLIVGGVTRLLPVTGVTLPFVSYGGSSMISSFVQLGLVNCALVAKERTLDEVSEAPRWNEG